VLFESVRELPEEMASKLKKRLPIKVVITDRDDDGGEGSEGSAWNGIAAKIAPPPGRVGDRGGHGATASHAGRGSTG